MLKIPTLSINAPHTDTATNVTLSPATRAPWGRVLLAEGIDRCVPLPLLSLLFPQWLIVVIAWHLFCDASPQRRSFGKWVCRLRVIHPSILTPCPLWRVLLQRVGIALLQVAWCLWWHVSWLVLLELLMFAFVLLSPTGQRPEEYLAGTQIMTEKVYRRRQQK